MTDYSDPDVRDAERREHEADRAFDERIMHEQPTPQQFAAHAEECGDLDCRLVRTGNQDDEWRHERSSGIDARGWHVPAVCEPRFIERCSRPYSHGAHVWQEGPATDLRHHRCDGGSDLIESLEAHEAQDVLFEEGAY